MTKQTALKVLKDYNLWRLGQLENFELTPTQITDALNIAIGELQKIENTRLIIQRQNRKRYANKKDRV